MRCSTGGHGSVVRGTHSVPGDRGPGAAVPGADQQHPAKGVQLQRDPQPQSGFRHHLCTMYPCAAGDTEAGRSHAGVKQTLWHDH